MPPKANILVVDDEPRNLLALESALKGLDQNIVTAGSGQECLRHLLDDDFAAIVLDVQMPAMDGYETARSIRARERSRTTPILFLTAHSKDDADIHRGYEFGAVDYIFKPFDPDIIRAKLLVFVELHNKTQLIKRQTKRMIEMERRQRKYELEAALHEQERKAAELLARKSEELERSNADLEQFAYIASHDLQEPLRMVSSYVELLARRYKGKLDKDADEFIAFAVDGANRMKELIDGLLAFSRIEAQGRKPEPADSEAVLGRVLKVLGSAIEESGCSITHDPMPPVIADDVQLEQVFQNLIGNAIKFRSEAPPRIHVSARCDGAECVFSVRDNGIGIDPQYAHKVFQIFQRLHARDEHPGQGLGLAVCKRIVERHCGRIWLDSKPQDGATFHFSLPSADPSTMSENKPE